MTNLCDEEGHEPQRGSSASRLALVQKNFTVIPTHAQSLHS